MAAPAGEQRVLTAETACGAGWRGFAFKPSSTLLAAGTFCGTDVKVWNLASGKPVAYTWPESATKSLELV